MISAHDWVSAAANQQLREIVIGLRDSTAMRRCRR
jgi:hypothetical protein